MCIFIMGTHQDAHTDSLLMHLIKSLNTGALTLNEVLQVMLSSFVYQQYLYLPCKYFLMPFSFNKCCQMLMYALQFQMSSCHMPCFSLPLLCNSDKSTTMDYKSVQIIQCRFTFMVSQELKFNSGDFFFVLRADTMKIPNPM